MTQADMVKVKRHGKLLAMDIGAGWQYWEYNGALYSINSDGDPNRMSIWCSITRLPEHLRKLERIHGYKYFAENKDMVIIDKERIAQFEQ